jgi:shikimate dehydrogenase
MHNAAFRHLGLNYCYLPFQVHPDNLEKAVEAVRALTMAGVNVTVPHKESVIPFLDAVNEEALFIGAVNTIVNEAGKLTGFNTDGRGFILSLEESAIAVGGKTALVVGCGGASRAIGYYLSEKAEKLSLFDIDAGKRENLVSDLSAIRSNVESLGQISDIGGFDIIINATPLGLKPGDPEPFDTSLLHREQTVCDLIYRKTRLLEKAAEKGCRTLDGLGMLLWQGALAFELWTSVAPPVNVMRDALLEGLK